MLFLCTSPLRHPSCAKGKALDQIKKVSYLDKGIPPVAAHTRLRYECPITLAFEKSARYDAPINSAGRKAFDAPECAPRTQWYACCTSLGCCLIILADASHTDLAIGIDEEHASPTIYHSPLLFTNVSMQLR
jgi:hypothetical protein